MSTTTPLPRTELHIERDVVPASFNLTVQTRAAAVVYPRTVDEVVQAVDYARLHGLRVAPQATGHNVAAYGSLDDALLVDVRHLQDVSIDATARRVRVGAGVKWERVVPQLSELGLAALHGSSPDVGIAGYSLGGGIGWLSRSHGMQTNSVTALEVVLADGRQVRADADHEPDLFWALRGGNGNYGVVTAIEFEVYPIAELYAGAMFFPFDRSGEVLRTWSRMLPSLPVELTTWVQLMHFPDAPSVPEPVRGGSFAIVLGAFIGTEAEGGDLLRPIRDLGPVMDTFAVVPPAELGDLAMDPPEPVPFDSAHAMLSDFSQEAVEALLAAVGPGTDAPIVLLQLRHMGGALEEVGPRSGARAALPGKVCAFALGVVPDAESAGPVRASLERFDQALAPWFAGEYPNFVERAAGDAGRFFDETTWERLRAVKAAYDPTDLFRGNHRVTPVSRPSLKRAMALAI